ncbi:Vegetative incompatibility protein HET-E-1 [Metarhizium anisopliae]|nr:Vegetative incompatibility protein HET-E-1 [Metarhizium anisopliae]
MPEPVVERDISTFLEYELARIREEYNASVANNLRFPPDWPTHSDIQSLAKMAVPLFIFAATVCRFISDRRYGNPEKQLKKVLRHQTKSHGSALAETYLLVLNQQIAGLEKQEHDEMLQEFRDIVGPIVILATPLSASALAQILGLSVRTINDRLDLLHSVLSVPQSTGSPVRLLHLSFRDFLLDADKRDDNLFWIDEKQTHADMAANCLHLLKCLKKNICDVRNPGTPRSVISAEKISAYLPQAVQYACLYWVYHMEKANIYIADGAETHGFLIRHFLHWIEGLALIGRASDSLSLVATLQSRLQPKESTELSQLLDDASRFLRTYMAVIDSTPLQIYSSLLIFAPKNSKVRTIFKDNVSWICLEPKVEDDWSQCIQTLEGHGDSVESVAFSHDSTLVTSASHDKTVRIWRSDTGECTQTLKGHDGLVSSAAFSRDLSLVASASSDKTVRIWRSNTGECIQILKSHGDSVRSAAFSHDSTLVASASDDKLVRIWRRKTGECIYTINLGITLRRLSFDPNTSLLLTEVGAVTIGCINATSMSTPSNSAVISPNFSGYGISRDMCWITWHGDNLLWLPVEFRPSCSNVSRSTVVIGSASGKVTTIGFSPDYPTACL